MNKKWLLFVGVAIALVIVIVSLTHRANPNPETRRVFAVLPLTGASSGLGQNAKAAIQMFVQSSNNKIGLDVEYIDSESQPSKAVSALRSKIAGKEKPIVISAPTYISNTLIPLVEENGGFLVAFATYLTNNNNKNDAPFQTVTTSEQDLIIPTVGYAKRNFGTVSIICANEDYGINNRAIFKSMFADASHRILRECEYKNNDETLRDMVAKVVSDKPEAIFVAGTPTPTYISVFKYIKQAGYAGVIMADGGFSSPFVLKALGKDAEGIVLSVQRIDLNDENGNEAFRDECQANQVVPYYLISEAYNAIKVVHDVYSSGMEFSRESLIKLNPYDGCADKLEFRKNGWSVYKTYLAQIQNGKVVSNE